MSFIGRVTSFPCPELDEPPFEWIDRYAGPGWCEIKISMDIGVNGKHKQFELEGVWDERCIKKSGKNIFAKFHKLVKNLESDEDMPGVYFDLSEIPREVEAKGLVLEHWTRLARRIGPPPKHKGADSCDLSPWITSHSGIGPLPKKESKMQGYFSKFNRIFNDCNLIIERGIPSTTETGRLFVNAMKANAEAIKLALINGQRFYVPESAQSIDNINFEEEENKKLIQLPYEVISVLTDVRDKDGYYDFVFAVGFEVGGDLDKKCYLVDTRAFDNANPSIAVIGAILQQGIWTPLPFVLGVDLESVRGIRFMVATCSYDHEIQTQIKKLAHPFGYHIANLCVMLSMANVKTRLLLPPEQLQKKRKIRGNSPLYSYHVLEVDSEIWDKQTINLGTGTGKRSHLRRGHIRRLDESRRVWVRACFVRGSVPGFVDKDYEIKPPQNNS
jgi:hypothetical protein